MIDDEILLHLVNNSNSTHINEKNRITAYGLIAAFKVIKSLFKKNSYFGFVSLHIIGAVFSDTKW